MQAGRVRLAPFSCCVMRFGLGFLGGGLGGLLRDVQFCCGHGTVASEGEVLYSTVPM
jgi:hypothetical protein